MKKTKDLVDAEAAFAAKTGEILAARLHMKRLEIELSESCAAVQKARADADASLPQEMCGSTREHALNWLADLEAMTHPG